MKSLFYSFILIRAIVKINVHSVLNIKPVFSISSSTILRASYFYHCLFTGEDTKLRTIGDLPKVLYLVRRRARM